MQRLWFCFAFALMLLGMSLVLTACVSTRRIMPGPSPEPLFRITTQPMKQVFGDFGIEERVYPIHAHAYTNGTVGISNRWPVRVHIDLAVDGSNFTRRIAYGVPAVSNRMDVEYEYSMPWWDMTLITENAKLRITDLEGRTLTTSSRPFQIRGINVLAPAAGETLVNGTTFDLQWYQAGGRNAITIGYITPTSEHVVLKTISNLVAGVNIYTWDVSGLPTTNELKIVLQSVEDTKIVGYSGIVSAQ